MKNSILGLGKDNSNINCYGLAPTAIGHASKYNPVGSSGKSTLSHSLLEVINAYHENKIAFGYDNNDNCIGEYQLDDKTQIAIYNPDKGLIIACNYELNKVIKDYDIRGKEYGEAIIVSLMPELVKDEEFKTYLADTCSVTRFSSLSDTEKDKVIHALYLLSDNLERRLTIIQAGKKNETKKEEIAIKQATYITSLVQISIDKNVYEPKEVLYGLFKVLSHTESVVERKATDLAGKYDIGKERTFTAEEKSRLVNLESFYVPTPEADLIAASVYNTRGTNLPQRNFVLRGVSGTGKSQDAKAVAAALNLPFGVVTCNDGTELIDLLTLILPNVSASNFNVTGADIICDPNGSYEKITGTKPDGVVDIAALIDLCLQKQKEDTRDFVAVDSDLVKAIKYGWVCEIQEVNLISKAGVLAGLNSILERSGQITLPTGEVINRHKDCVIIMTNNIGYAGCHPINQAVLRRQAMILTKKLPTIEETMARTKAITGFKDDAKLRQMVELVYKISEYCNINNITDGCCGPTEVYDWVQSFSLVTHNLYDSLITCVVEKATQDEEEQQSIIDNIIKPTGFDLN